MHRFEQDRRVLQDKLSSGRRAGFLRSEDGSLIVFGLFVFLMMAAVAGMAVDFMRFETQRTRLQSTLDRAILAASSLDQALDPEDVVLDYFTKAGLGDFIDASMINVYENDRLIDDNWAGASAQELTSRRVEASAQMTIGTTFLKFSGIDFLGAPASGTAEESASLTEISLVLDVSGSMDWDSASGNTKIEELRDAATKFVNIVLCDPSDPTKTSDCVIEEGKVSVSIVPYAEQVLVGEDLLDYFGGTDEHEYSSCADFEEEDFETTAISPYDGVQRAGAIDPWPSSPSNYRWDHHDPDYPWIDKWHWYHPIVTCRTESWREVTAVSGDADLLRDRIDALEGNGGTSIDIGMKWGVALLDPAAQPVVEDLVDDDYTDEAYEGRPLNWNTIGSEKVIVLMTDGQNFPQYELYNDFYSGASPVYRTNEKVGNGSSAQYYYSIYRASTDTYKWEHNGEWHDHPYGTGTYEECHNEWVRTGRYSGYWREVCEDVEEEGEGAEAMDYADLWAEKPWVWYEKWTWLPSPGHQLDNDTKDDRLQASCDAAKAAGITVFSVGFEVPESSASLDVLRNCATSAAHYFNSDGLDLAADFAAIAREINKLRLTN